MFKAALKAGRKLERWWAVFFLVLLLIAFIPFCWMESRVNRTGFDTWCIFIGAIDFSLFVITVLYISRLLKKRLRDLGLLCPNCGKQITALSSQVVIATGKCGHCGGRVLVDNH